jgi:putative peptidoglycan lipid II flippase
MQGAFGDWGARYVGGDYPAALAALNGAADQLNDHLAGITGVGGLALGYSAIFLVELALLLIILRRRWHDIDARNLGITTLRTLAATGIMGAAVLAADAVFGVMGWHDAGTVLTGLRVIGLAGVGAVSFGIAGVLVGLRELRDLPGMVLRRRKAL